MRWSHVFFLGSVARKIGKHKNNLRSLLASSVPLNRSNCSNVVCLHFLYVRVLAFLSSFLSFSFFFSSPFAFHLFLLGKRRNFPSSSVREETKKAVTICIENNFTKEKKVGTLKSCETYVRALNGCEGIPRARIK